MPKLRIVCVSANPAMDRRVHVDALRKGSVNRALLARGFAGGKAAHVAMAARALVDGVAWIGFLGGAIGAECAAQLKSVGITVNAISTAAPTRVNLEILEADGEITEILEPGRPPARAERERFRRAIQGIPKQSLMVISGSLPAGLAPDFYASLIEEVSSKGIRVFLDTSGAGLRAGVKAGPHFVKVNRNEAEELTGRSIRSEHEALRAAQEVMRDGAGSAAVTLGKEGVVWMESAEGSGWFARPPKVQCISSVGCGDATLAGFVVAVRRGLGGEKAIRLAVACGAANCSAETPGRITGSRVRALLKEVYVKQI
jgi:1-phosphofructokinase family hexose kinase